MDTKTQGSSAFLLTLKGVLTKDNLWNIVSPFTPACQRLTEIQEEEGIHFSGGSLLELMAIAVYGDFTPCALQDFTLEHFPSDGREGSLQPTDHWEVTQIVTFLLEKAKGLEPEEPCGIRLLKKYPQLSLPPRESTNAFHDAYIAGEKTGDARKARLIFAEAGFPTAPWVFKFRGKPGGQIAIDKRPACSDGWQGSTCNAEVIKKENCTCLGVALGGETLKSGYSAAPIFVVDQDTHGGKNGEATWDSILKSYGVKAETLTERTQSGGLHAFFALPEEFKAFPYKFCGPFLSGVDFLNRNGVIVAPSHTRHPQTREELRYSLIEDYPVCRNRTILRIIWEQKELSERKKRQPLTSSIPLITDEAASYNENDAGSHTRLLNPSHLSSLEKRRLRKRAEIWLEKEAERFRKAPEGARNKTLVSAVFRLASIAWSAPDLITATVVQDRFYGAATLNGYLEDTSDSTFFGQVKSAWEYGVSRPYYQIQEKNLEKIPSPSNSADENQQKQESGQDDFFGSKSFELDAFPYDVFGEELGAVIDIVASECQAHKLLVATELLGVVAGVVQDQADCAIKKGRRSPLSLYCIALAGTGQGKTSVEHMLSVGLETYEKAKEDGYKKALRRYYSLLTNFQKNLAKSQKEGSSQAQEGQLQEPERPIAPDFILRDATVEGLARKLPFNRKSVMILLDEGAQLFEGYNFKAESRLKSISQWCDFYSGSTAKIQRATSNFDVTLRGYRMSWAICGQPNLLDILMKPEMSVSGLMPRCLVANVPPVPDQKCILETPERAENLQFFYDKCQKFLDTAPSFDQEGNRPLILPNEEAKKLIIKKYYEIRKADKEGFFDGYEGVRDRILETATRIAAILTVWEKGTNSCSSSLTFDALTFLRGWSLARWYACSWISLEKDGVDSQTKKDAEAVMAAILSGKIPTMHDGETYSMRSIAHYGPYAIRGNGEGMHSRRLRALDYLCGRGLLEQKSKAKDATGKLTSLRYVILSRK